MWYNKKLNYLSEQNLNKLAKWEPVCLQTTWMNNEMFKNGYFWMEEPIKWTIQEIFWKILLQRICVLNRVH